MVARAWDRGGGLTSKTHEVAPLWALGVIPLMERLEIVSDVRNVDAVIFQLGNVQEVEGSARQSWCRSFETRAPEENGVITTVSSVVGARQSGNFYDSRHS